MRRLAMARSCNIVAAKSTATKATMLTCNPPKRAWERLSCGLLDVSGRAAARVARMDSSQTRGPQAADVAPWPKSHLVSVFCGVICADVAGLSVQHLSLLRLQAEDLDDIAWRKARCEWGCLWFLGLAFRLRTAIKIEARAFECRSACNWTLMQFALGAWVLLDLHEIRRLHEGDFVLISVLDHSQGELHFEHVPLLVVLGNCAVPPVELLPRLGLQTHRFNCIPDLEWQAPEGTRGHGVGIDAIHALVQRNIAR
mmetsp:Transcript_27329/g.78703  ORF Transcript_27329/g.78703 Transcript_27329/m.78703 type:complete len:255 (+) Transcript_27329:174-938(+)